MPSCDKLNNETAKVRIGDVCVTTHAVNWDCKLSDWTAQCAAFPNQCFIPEAVNGVDASYAPV